MEFGLALVGREPLARSGSTSIDITPTDGSQDSRAAAAPATNGRRFTWAISRRVGRNFPATPSMYRSARRRLPRPMRVVSNSPGRMSSSPMTAARRPRPPTSLQLGLGHDDDERAARPRCADEPGLPTRIRRPHRLRRSTRRPRFPNRAARSNSRQPNLVADDAESRTGWRPSRSPTRRGSPPREAAAPRMRATISSTRLRSCATKRIWPPTTRGPTASAHRSTARAWSCRARCRPRSPAAAPRSAAPDGGGEDRASLGKGGGGLRLDRPGYVADRGTQRNAPEIHGRRGARRWTTPRREGVPPLADLRRSVLELLRLATRPHDRPPRARSPGPAAPRDRDGR